MAQHDEKQVRIATDLIEVLVVGILKPGECEQ